MKPGVQSGLTYPQSVLFSCSMFTGQAGRATMLMLANLLFLPPLGSVGPRVTLQQLAANRDCPMLLISLLKWEHTL